MTRTMTQTLPQAEEGSPNGNADASDATPPARPSRPRQRDLPTPRSPSRDQDAHTADVRPGRVRSAPDSHPAGLISGDAPSGERPRGRAAGSGRGTAGGVGASQ